MAVELTRVGLARVGVGIEMDESERPVTVDASETRPVPVGDGVVAAEDDRDGTCLLYTSDAADEHRDV